MPHSIRRDRDDALDLLPHIPALRRYALLLTRDRDSADDLVQECLLRAIDHADHFQPGSNLRGWLYAILRNFHRNSRVRRGWRTRPFASPEEEQALAPAVAPAQAEAMALRDLWRALLQLPQEQREVLLLVGVEMLSYEEAAALLKVPVGTIRSRLSRGRTRLMQLLGQDALLD